MLIFDQNSAVLAVFFSLVIFEMAKLPICVVMGSGGKNPDTIIQGVVGDLPVPDEAGSGLMMYTWNITNKYYSASINLCSMSNETTAFDEDFIQRADASIIYFDSNDEKNGLDEVEKLLPIVESFEPETKILVADQCAIDEGSKQVTFVKAQQWCIKHGFELVELNSLGKSDPEDDFPETLGIDRVIEALHAHPWSNLQLNTCSEKSGVEGALVDEADEILDNCPLDGDTSQQMGEPEADTFEELFQHMCSMKNQAGTLDGAQRKAYAEKMTMAFWQAIGGDDGEIEGLASADEE